MVDIVVENAVRKIERNDYQLSGVLLQAPDIILLSLFIYRNNIVNKNLFLRR
jgi:hypothetical protein